MPTSRFDININQPYQSVRIPLPLDYLAGIAKNIQGEHDEGLHATDAFSKIGNAIEAAPMYRDEKNAYINSFNQERDNLYNSTKSYSDPEFKRKANELITRYASDPRLDMFKATNQAFKDWQAQSKDPNNQMNLDWTYQRNPDGSFKQISLNNGIYSPTFTKFEDYDETAKKIMGHVREDGSLKDSGYDFSNPNNTRINNGETIVFNSNTRKWEGVTSGKLENLSNLMAEDYANTTAGKHHLQSLLGQNITYKQLDDNTKSQVNKIFANHLYKANANQIGGKTENKQDYHFETDRNRQKDNDEKYNADNTPIYLWNILTGEGVAPEKNMLNHTLESINSGFKFNNKGELEEKTSLESSYKDSNKVNSYTDKKTGVKYDLNNLPEGWKVKTNKHIKEQPYDIIVNDKGEEINLTMKEYYGQFSHNFGTVSVKTYSPSEGYLKQQQEVLSFLKNSNQYDDKKSVQENYKSGIKLYGDAIKSAKLNAMSIPEFDAVTAKAFEDYYLPKFTENKDGTLVLKDAGRTAQWSIEGIDKGTEDGQKEFNNIVAGSNIVGPDLSKGGSHVLLNTRGGKMVSVNLNNQTLAANFEALSNFNKKNNEAIYLPNKSKTIKDFSEATLTNKKQVSTLDDMQNQMLNLTQEYSPADIQEVGASLEKDRHNIDNISLTLKKNNYQPLNTYYDKESNTIGMSFINRQDPNNPDIKVIHYQPGTEPTLVSNAVFNRDIYQKLFGKIAVNMSDKSNNFTGKQLKTQKPR